MGIGGTRRRLAIVSFVGLTSVTYAAMGAAAPPRKKKPPAPPAAAPASTTAPAPASSASANDKTRAAELYKKSADAYLHGDFGLAIKLLDEAYALDPQPVLVYNQARAHEGLGHVDEAIALYEKYLSQEPTSPDRGAIEQRLSTLHKQKEERERLDKEKADVEARREQQQQQQRELEKREQEMKTAPEPRKRSPLPYVVAGVGAAGVITGTVFGFLALDKEESGNSSSSLRDATDARDTGQTFATVSNVSFIVGGVLLAGGVVWWIIDGGGGSSETKTGAAKRPIFLGGTF
jgi:tetratricopeptide (TPR) repeat protein